jgi:hypothetical protein
LKDSGAYVQNRGQINYWNASRDNLFTFAEFHGIPCSEYCGIPAEIPVPVHTDHDMGMGMDMGIGMIMLEYA